ncbi:MULTISPECIES: hypothetical protein [unclassified Sphingopyxis]|uniref:hypothetical protein n=1 Tax=unclassified Sphingopyxis TaxID=2614943 RepID=UPI00073716F4|nr:MULTISPECIES: hypothetical protein [unclassified Sphingopyxis]KTE46418.1 hypothetical protein ATE62_00285 [Sphingopyxis sp. HIX]KTE85021.1 hypothetical protein ATE72_05890 [Sphingopyxis sp. HXXIV]
MNIYTARFPEISGYLTIIADADIRARRLALVWFRHRFHREPSDIAIDANNTDWELGAHTLSPRARHEGIAYWQREQGWIVVPPDFDDPGAYYRSLPRVLCYEFVTSREDARTLIFAPSRANANLVFDTWKELHGRTEDRLWRAEAGIMPPTTRDRRMRLRTDQALGFVGLARSGIAGWEVVPPWHPYAGDFTQGSWQDSTRFPGDLI